MQQKGADGRSCLREAKRTGGGRSSDSRTEMSVLWACPFTCYGSFHIRGVGLSASLLVFWDFNWSFGMSTGLFGFQPGSQACGTRLGMVTVCDSSSWARLANWCCQMLRQDSFGHKCTGDCAHYPTPGSDSDHVTSCTFTWHTCSRKKHNISIAVAWQVRHASNCSIVLASKHEICC